MVALDEFIVMPNHVHGIIVITDVAAAGAGIFRPAQPPPDGSVGAGNFTPRRQPIAIMPKKSLGHIMQTFKAAVSRQAIRDGLMPRGTPIWQRGYYEHIIRDGDAHDRIAQYIRDNPANWPTDRFRRDR